MIKNHKDRFKFFFSRFPKVQYDIEGGGETMEVKNLFKRFAFHEIAKSNAANFVEWIIRDEDTPETMADRLYGSTQYFWIILMFNDILDPFWDWPLDYKGLSNFVEAKYGANNVQDVHHYIATESTDPLNNVPAGTTVDEYYPYKEPVSNTQYEYEINEAKRKIKILDPDGLGEVLSQFNAIMESNFTRVNGNAG